MTEKNPHNETKFEHFVAPSHAPIIIDKPLPTNTGQLSKLITRAEKYITKKDQK